jgi:CheY-like chemotaxis protein
MARQVAGNLGGGRVEQERAAAIIHVMAAAARMARLPPLARPPLASVAAVVGGEAMEIAEALNLGAAGAPMSRCASLAAGAVLRFIERAGSPSPSAAEATSALEALTAAAALPLPAIDALRAVVYQGADMSRETVVIADSDLTAAGLLQQRLLVAGLRTVVTRTGAEATDLMLRGARALVASSSLPDTDGPSLVTAVRSQASKVPPVIYLLTSDSAGLNAGMDAGADDVMIQPVNAEIVAAKLRRALGTPARRT